MRVLITGAAGFIGSHLADRLERDGHSVHGVDNLETGRDDNWDGFTRLDIADRQQFYGYANMIKPELVIHCAASYSDPDKWHRDTDTNITGTINAVLAAKHHGAKLIYFQTALPPVSSYAISKIAGEHYIRQSDVPYLIFRLANVYGPRNVSGPIPTFFKRLSARERCQVVPAVRDMVYVDDLVDCVMMALESGREGCFDVCSGEAVPILALYRIVAQFFPNSPEPELLRTAVGDVVPATSVHAWLSGWSPTTPLQYGIAEAISWYRKHGVAETYTHLKRIA